MTFCQYNNIIKMNFVTVCIIDLDNVNLNWWFDFVLEPIFVITPAASKNSTHFKSGQNRPKNNYLASLTKVQAKSLIHKLITLYSTFNCTSMITNILKKNLKSN